MKPNYWCLPTALFLVLLSSGRQGHAVNDGVMTGNGNCHAKNSDGSAGKYCGKGNGKSAGTACECGLFISAPHFTLDGIDVIVSAGDAPIVSAVLPNVGDTVFTVQLWDGSAYAIAAYVRPNEVIAFPPGGVLRFRVTEIDNPEDFDLGSSTNFPISLEIEGGEPFKGSVVAFSEAMPIELHGDAQSGQIGLWWYGGSGPFVVQTAQTFGGPWTSVAVTDSRELLISATGTGALHRVLGSNGDHSSVVDEEVTTIPTLSEWGVIVLGIFLLLAVLLQKSSRRVVDNRAA